MRERAQTKRDEAGLSDDLSRMKEPDDYFIINLLQIKNNLKSHLSTLKI